MQILSKEVFIPHDHGRPAFPGLISYISKDKPILLHRYGWEDASDNRDDWMDSYSHDNGRTWSKPVIVQKSSPVPGGRIKYMESCAYFDADTNKLIVLSTKSFYPDDQLDEDQPYMIEISVLDPVTGTWSSLGDTTFGYKEGVAISFCFPIKTSKGRLIFPGCKQQIGADSKPVHVNNCWAPADQSIAIIGDYRPDGSIEWKASEPISIDLTKSGRGVDENTILELADGTLVMVIRGSNDGLPPGSPGYKWIASSRDGGLTWSEPKPWTYTDGVPVESSATGSCLFRSSTNGKVYWMGNLCMNGVKAQGNWPRSPLFIAEVQESPFALRRDTVTVIDERQTGESPGCQMSNFRYYQDREDGQIVLFLTRFGEQDEKEWRLANYYRYRIQVS